MTNYVSWGGTFQRIYHTLPYDNDTIFEGNSLNQIRRDFVYDDSINSICRKCIKAECIRVQEPICNFKGINQSEDKLLSTICFDSAKKIYYIKKAFYGYRYNDNSISNKFFLRNYLNCKVVSSYILPYFKKWNIDERAYYRFVGDTVQKALLCVVSVFGCMQEGKLTHKDWNQTVEYLFSDKELRNAYLVGTKGVIPLHYKGVCRSLVKKHKTLLYIQMKCLYWMKVLKNKLLK